MVCKFKKYCKNYNKESKTCNGIEENLLYCGIYRKKLNEEKIIICM